MAINYPGFGPIPRADLSGIGDIVENMAKGYKIGRMPDTMREEQEGRMRENALMAMKQAFMPNLYDSQIQKAKMEYDPEAKADYLKRLSAALERNGGVDLSNPLVRHAMGLPVETTEEKETAKAETKRRAALKEEIPVAHETVNKVDQAIEIATRHPEWFGPGAGGFDSLGGPSYRKRKITDPEYGTLETIFGGLVGPQAQEFSTRGLGAALKLAQEIKPGFNENMPIVLGKLNQIKKGLEGVTSRKENQLDNYTPAKAGSPVASRRESVGDKISRNEPIKVPPRFRTEAEFDRYFTSLTPKEKGELQRYYNVIRKKAKK